MTLLFLNSTGYKHWNLFTCQLESENGRRLTAGLTRLSTIEKDQNKDPYSEKRSGSCRGFVQETFNYYLDFFLGHVFSCHTGITKSVHI